MMNKFDCPSCSRSFDSQQGMYSHHGKSHGESLTTVELKCDACSENFKRQRSEVNSECTYCSENCRQSGNASGKRNQKSINCYNCDTTFSRAKSTIGSRNFCSEKCRNGWLSDYFKGANHPRWVEDSKNNRGNNWENIREVVIERDFEKCRSCRMSRENHKSKFGQDLHVHHKIPFRLFDNNKEANKMYNLITYCVECHMTIENEVRAGVH